MTKKQLILHEFVFKSCCHLNEPTSLEMGGQLDLLDLSARCEQQLSKQSLSFPALAGREKPV